jgi:DNA-binding MarR family transcriptional regulator
MHPKEFELAVDEFKHAMGLLVRRMRAAAPSEQHELSWTQKSIMVRLDREGPMTAADLARAEGVKPQSMGTAIAHLEEMGLVEKRPHASDGRQFNIKIPSTGATLRKHGTDASRAWLVQTMLKLDKKEQAVLFEAGKIIKKLAEI